MTEMVKDKSTLCRLVLLDATSAVRYAQSACAGKKMRMSIAIKSRLLFAAVFVLSLPLCFAQTSPVTFAFTGADTPLWDLSGNFQINDVLQGVIGGQDVPLSFGITLTDDGHGRLRGSDAAALSGPILVTVGNDTVAAHYVVIGRVAGGVNDTRITLMIRLTGEDVIAGITTKFSIIVRYKLAVVEGVLQGTSRGSAKFSRLGTAIIRNPEVSIPLPAGMDGSWSLQMNFVPFKKLAGIGTIVLSNGRNLSFRLSGSSSAGRFAVKLIGINENLGGRLGLIFFDGAANPEVVTGRILGQTIRQ